MAFSLPAGGESLRRGQESEREKMSGEKERAALRRMHEGSTLEEYFPF